MAKAKRLPSGNWRVQASITVNGERVCKSFTASTAKDAEIAALQWQTDKKEKTADPSSLTVNEAIDEIIEMKSNVLSPSSIKGYKCIQRNHIKGIERVKIKDLSYSVLQKWVNDMAGRLSPKTIKNAFGLVVSAIHIFAPKQIVPKITLPQAKKENPAALTKQETAILLNGIQGHQIEIPILLALWLGLRRSEIMALEWQDIDFDKMKITINKALVPSDTGHALKQPKTTDSERVLSLPIYIAEKLKPLQKKNGRVFEMEPNRCTKIFPKICEGLGLPKYRFHDLRHSMATVGVSLNIADKLVMARGGWNNVKTMKKVYQAVLQDDTETADILYDNYFNSLLMSHEMSHENCVTV